MGKTRNYQNDNEKKVEKRIEIYAHYETIQAILNLWKNCGNNFRDVDGWVFWLNQLKVGKINLGTNLELLELL